MRKKQRYFQVKPELKDLHKQILEHLKGDIRIYIHTCRHTHKYLSGRRKNDFRGEIWDGSRSWSLDGRYPEGGSQAKAIFLLPCLLLVVRSRRWVSFLNQYSSFIHQLRRCWQGAKIFGLWGHNHIAGSEVTSNTLCFFKKYLLGYSWLTTLCLHCVLELNRCRGGFLCPTLLTEGDRIVAPTMGQLCSF